jgi:hypothetical protein
MGSPLGFAPALQGSQDQPPVGFRWTEKIAIAPGTCPICLPRPVAFATLPASSAQPCGNICLFPWARAEAVQPTVFSRQKYWAILAQGHNGLLCLFVMFVLRVEAHATRLFTDQQRVTDKPAPVYHVRYLTRARINSTLVQ